MTKLKKRSGFTLAELLIVVAIIAILVAIGIPAFSTAMERSRETVDLANVRSAYAEFMATVLDSSSPVPYAYQIDFKQRDISDWKVNTADFLTNLSNSTMPPIKATGDGYAVYSLDSGNNRPTLAFYAPSDTLPDGTKKVSTSS